MLPNLIPVDSRWPTNQELAEGQSSALYDHGESIWPLKIHLGCGGVRLRGYINVDIAGSAARYHPELAEANATDIWNYYARLEGSATDLPKRRPTYADLIGDLEESYQVWSCLPGTVDKIVCLQMFEHLSPVKAGNLLGLIYRLLKPGCHSPLILSVPDMEGTIDMLEDAPATAGGGLDTVEGMGNFRFAIRHLRGSRRDEYAHHRAWYTRETLTELLQHYGFDVADLPNVHLYPAVCLRAERP